MQCEGRTMTDKQIPNENEHLSERTDRIRQLNDRFRRGDRSLGRVLFAGSLARADVTERLLVYDRVKQFEAFDEGNDGYGEHDFGSFEYKGLRYMFKIDYYDQRLEFGADDPADPATCLRVLSIFYAEDY